MKATYYMKLDELTPEFINNLKKQFKNAFVEIFLKVSEETDHLSLSENKKQFIEVDEMFGIWKDRDITKEKLRDVAWGD